MSKWQAAWDAAESAVREEQAEEIAHQQNNIDNMRLEIKEMREGIQLSQAQRIAELEAQLVVTEKERDEWKNSAINGGNAAYLREQLAKLKKQEPK